MVVAVVVVVAMVVVSIGATRERETKGGKRTRERYRGEAKSREGDGIVIRDVASQPFFCFSIRESYTGTDTHMTYTRTYTRIIHEVYLPSSGTYVPEEVYSYKAATVGNARGCLLVG
ncbi:hypothetical protein F5X99DRAFT_397037 [Biscogniauxia marginata]|nr:hypothetical protein F5X99DRAFT_397037 [Biscogniauxia marginata]